MRGKWPILVGVCVLMLALVGAGALTLRLKQAQAPAPAAKAGGAALITNSVNFTGKIRAQHITLAGSDEVGDIESFFADVGDEVTEGQLLARVGSVAPQAVRDNASEAVDKAQDRLKMAEEALNAARLEASRADADAERSRTQLDAALAVFSRQQTLYSKGATPRLTFEKSQRDAEDAQKEYEIVDKADRAANDNVTMAESAVAVTQKDLDDKTAALDDAQASLDATEIHAPVEGLIVGRQGAVGDPASLDMFQIATDTYALEITVTPPDDVRKRVHPGTPALVIVPELLAAGLEGQVKEVRDKEKEVVVEFGSTISAIRPGMLADVRFKLD